ncbi:hypothetical protein CALCODRAFT_14908 [Calocera cornea HHB12733]|uniref:Uncharacterized protein n=1 Tax=Calocera cornea HHB12733 TaxID=1353952 RepID=A0A165E9P0_9BASI|nr:hypothetical protein CALCODRAFT_14908 [Calocera cornea HHB12733]
MSGPLTSAATKFFAAGAGAALTYSALPLAHERAWLSHPALDKLPSLAQVAESAALAFVRTATRGAHGGHGDNGGSKGRALQGGEEGLNGWGRKEGEREMTFEEEVEYFLKPDMTGWRF